MNIATTYTNMINNVTSFAGGGLLWPLFLICALILLIKAKKTPVKHLLVWFPIMVFVCYFCPIWTLYFSTRKDGAILYRLLWLIPFSCVICYTFVEAVFLLPKKEKTLFFVLSIVIIMLCGNYVYDNPGFSRAENTYHVPQEVVDICDEIVVPGREVKAAFPNELVGMVRQYSPYIVLTYGRGVLLSGGTQEYSDVSLFLNSSEVDADILCTALRESETAYVIIPSDAIIKGSMAEHEFYYVKTIGNYDIYLDDYAYLGLGNE